MLYFFDVFARASKALVNFIIGIFVSGKNKQNHLYGESPLQIQKIQYEKYVSNLDL